MLPLGARLRGPRGLGDPGPQPARGTELGDGEELVRRRGVPELDLAERGFDAEPTCGEGAQVGDSGGQREPELLGRAAAGLVVRQGVHGQGAHPRQAGGGLPGQLDGGGLVQRLAGPRLVAQRVGAQRGPHSLRSHRALGVQVQQRTGGRGVVGTRVQGDGGEVQVDPVQGPGETVDRDAAAAHGEPEGGDPVLQVGQGRLVQALRVGAGEALAHVPAVRGGAFRPASADEGGEAGKTGVGQRPVGRRGVQRAGGEPVLESGGQRIFCGLAGDFLARLAQYAFYKALPLLMRRVRELGGQGEPVVRQDRHGSNVGERAQVAPYRRV